MDDGVTHVNGYGNPPPVRTAARFQNPLIEDDDDDESVGTVETPPPPDVIEGALEKQLEGLSMLLHSAFASTFERQCAGLPLPKELIDSVDLAWIIGTNQKGVDFEKYRARLSPAAAASLESPPRSHRAGKGLKSLLNIFDHRTESILIDSPRSVVLLNKGGFSANALRQGDDPAAESRRLRTIANLKSEYITLSRQVSQHCVVEYLRRGRPKMPGVPQKRPLGFVSPAAKRMLEEGSVSRERGSPTSDEDSSPTGQKEQRSHSSLAATTPARKSGSGLSRTTGSSPPRARTPSVKGEVSPQRGGKRTNPRNLARLLQHRETLAAQWGLRQQKLVNEAYQAERIDQLHAKMAEAKKDLVPKASPSASPNRSKATTPAQRISPPPATTATAQTTVLAQPPGGGTSTQPPPGLLPAISSPSNKSRVSVSSASAPSDAASTTEYKRGLTLEEKQRRKEKVEAMKVHQKNLETTRRQELDAKIARKDQLVQDASKKRALKAKEMKEFQRAKARQVKEVNDRMRRSAAYDQLQMVRQMEANAERSVARVNLVEKQRRQLQEEHRRRNCLEHETRKFVHASNVQLEKMLSLQEVQARRSKGTLTHGDDKIVIQRQLKEESRELLKRLLKHEDRLIAEWKSFDEAHSGGTPNSPSPTRANS